MKKIFLNNLPTKQGIGKNKDKIVFDWQNSIRKTVKFIYNNTKGEIQIIDYNKKNHKLTVLYKDKYKSEFITSNFVRCQIDQLFKIDGYVYDIGTILNKEIHSGRLQIIERFKRPLKSNKKHFEKMYRYKCLICGNIDVITENAMIHQQQGCNVCSHNKVLKGYNDIWTTNPDLAKLLANPEDGYKYSEGSEKRVDWECPHCGNIIKNKIINKISQRRLICPKCSDGISYPEKFMFNVLERLNLEFKTQLNRIIYKWCNTYKYDFYFEYNNEKYIIETHGKQHYDGDFVRANGKTLEEEQENDKLKKELAIQNGIKEENYIIIDCRKSELEYIKDNVLHSRLNEIFDLSQIDWLKCHEFACSSRVKEACDYWNNGINNTRKIAKKMNLNRSTIITYLKKGKKLNWCNYNPKEEILKNYKRIRKNSKDYHTSPIFIKYIINKTKEIIGEKNVSEYLEIRANENIFFNYLSKKVPTYNIKLKDNKFIKNDYLNYKKNRCIISDFLYDKNLEFIIQFYKNSIILSDYIVFILPMKQLNNNIELYEFNLIYSENLNKQFDKINCCLNIYRRPIDGQLNKKFNYKLNDITIKEYRKNRESTYEKTKKENFNYDIRICGCGKETIGKEVKFEGQYIKELCIKINNIKLKNKVLELIRTTNWEQDICDNISSLEFPSWRIFKYIKEKIPEIK